MNATAKRSSRGWRSLFVVRTVLQAALLLLSTNDNSVQATDFSFPNTTLTRMAFGSCHKRKYVSNHDNNIWKTIQQKSNPQLWLWTGDAVYPATRGIASLEMLQAEYQQMAENDTLGYSTFHPPLGTFGTWDDHDYGGNDMGYEIPNKSERADLFWRFLRQAKPQNRQGIYSSVTVGLKPQQVKIILLDTRWHRQEHCIPSVATQIPLGAAVACVTRWLAAGLFPGFCKTSSKLLGEEQWEWLQDELNDESPAVTLVVSSIQVLTTNPVMEGWGHFPAERDRLIRLLSKKTGGVYILSGDVHYAEILDPMPLLKDSFLEITSSGLTHTCSSHYIGGFLCKPLLDSFWRHRFDNPHNYYIGKNYGTLDFDWQEQTVEVQIHDSSGKVVLSTGARHWQEPQKWTEEHYQYVHEAMDGHLWPFIRTAFVAMLVLIITVVGLAPRTKRR